MVLLCGPSVLCREHVDPGYPRLDDPDHGNPGRGALVATWRLTIPESRALGNAIDRIIIEDAQGGLVVQALASPPIVKVVGKYLYLYVNQHIQ